jgi:hypothetical protein
MVRRLVKIVIDAEGLSIKLKGGCNVILEGYVEALRQGGSPIVLAERDQELGKLGVDSFKPPSNFWEKPNWDRGIHDLAVFEDGSAINWHESELHVYWDISHLLELYDQFSLDNLESYEEALRDYPALEKYRSMLCSETTEEPY